MFEPTDPDDGCGCFTVLAVAACAVFVVAVMVGAAFFMGPSPAVAPSTSGAVPLAPGVGRGAAGSSSAYAPVGQARSTGIPAVSPRRPHPVT